MLAEADMPLPGLREDLRLIESATGRNGEPTWVIQDSVLNRFYRIGWLEFECLVRWGGASARQLCDQIRRQTSLRPEPDQVIGFRRFLENHQLVRPDAAMLERLEAQSRSNPWLTARWWVHHYLFFRVPLLRPQRGLNWLARHLDWLFSRGAAWTVSLLGILGVVLVLQQWDQFRHAVVESISFAGLLSFACALIVAKTFHELGHALVATRLGLKVAHMGIAFVVLWPMLYTDTGESWKLRDARQRLAIASAGIVAELMLAGLATLGWVLAEPGFLRNALLYLATTSWVLSLALNASPFMRFDGYFILSDLLDFPNLHERSFAQARVALRRGLLGLDEPWPEPFSAGQRRWLIAFAFATWLYRLVLFTVIAIAIYLFFFKALGVVLFAVEIAWFIALPVWREFSVWWSKRAQLSRSRRLWIPAWLGLALLLLALPWRTEVHGAGVARSQQQLRVFAPYPARLQRIEPNGPVRRGQVLVALDQPDITAQLLSSEAGLRGVEARLSGLIDDSAGLEQLAALRETLGMRQEQSRAARLEIQRLELVAPFDGVWRDTDPAWQAGQWVETRESLGVIIDPAHWQVDAYVEPDEVHRLRAGSAVRFFAAGYPRPIAGRVVEVASTRARQISHPMLASQFQGPLGTAQDSDTLTPNPPLFHVLVQLDGPPPGGREIRGDVHIEGERRSPLLHALARLAAVLRREGGF